MAQAFIEDTQIKFAKDGDRSVRHLRTWDITQNRRNNIQALIEIFCAGASKESVNEIVAQWKITNQDCLRFAKVTQVQLEIEVGVWFVMKERDKHLIVGSSISAFYALCDLWQKLLLKSISDVGS